MADTLTYNIIATTTLGANAGSVTFSSIPGTYTDLVLVSNVATTSSTNFGYYLNNDAASNYGVINMYGNGSSTSSANYTGEGALWANWNNYTSTTVGNSIYISNIQNYASTSIYKTVITRGDFGGQGTEIVIGVWKSLSAVTSIVITTPSGWPLKAGSIFSLYGITSA